MTLIFVFWKGFRGHDRVN